MHVGGECLDVYIGESVFISYVTPKAIRRTLVRPIAFSCYELLVPYTRYLEAKAQYYYY